MARGLFDAAIRDRRRGRGWSRRLRLPQLVVDQIIARSQSSQSAPGKKVAVPPMYALATLSAVPELNGACSLDRGDGVTQPDPGLRASRGGVWGEVSSIEAPRGLHSGERRDRSARESGRLGVLSGDLDGPLLHQRHVLERQLHAWVPLALVIHGSRC